MCRDYLMLILLVCLVGSLATLAMGIYTSVLNKKFVKTEAISEYNSHSNLARYVFRVSDVNYIGVTFCNLKTVRDCQQRFQNQVIEICYQTSNPNNSEYSHVCNGRGNLSIILVVVGAITCLLFMIIITQVVGMTPRNLPPPPTLRQTQVQTQTRREMMPQIAIEMLELDTRNVMIGAGNDGKCVVVTQP